LARVEKVARRGSSAEAYLLAGQTLLKMDEFERARDDADAALRLNPRLPGALTLRGVTLQYLGDNPGAIAVLRKALEGDPNDFEAHLTLGAVLSAERELADARPHLERALQLNPGSNLARYTMARLERTEGKLDAAIRDFETVIKADPNWPQPHLELSALYFRISRQSDGERERATYDKLSAQQPK
jgi:tetratricopeptide (TPR) repeat protein